jgi:hypothetical protein
VSHLSLTTADASSNIKGMGFQTLDIYFTICPSNKKKLRRSKEFEDSQGLIGIRKSKKNRQHNGLKKKDKRTNNDPQNITHKTKDGVKRTPLKITCMYFPWDYLSNCGGMLDT